MEGEGVYNVDYTSMKLASEQLTDDSTLLANASAYIDSNLSGMDPRIADYIDGLYNISGMASKLNDYSTRTTTYQSWMDDTVGRIKEVDSNLAEIPETQKGPGNSVDQGGNNQGDHNGDENGEGTGAIDSTPGTQGSHQGEGDGDITCPGDLPPGTQGELEKILKDMGFSDDEIAKILSGERELTPQEMEQLKAYLEELAKTNPDLAKQIAAAFGLNLDSLGDGTGDHEGEETTINPEEFDKLPDDVKDDITQILRDLGYSEEDIAAILRGEKELTPEDMEKIKAYIDKLRGKDDDLADQLDLAFGIPNAWAELPQEVKDQIKSMLEQMGYSPEDINDIVHGRKDLTPEELEAIKAYIDSIRDQDPELADKLDLVFGIPNLWAELAEADKNLLRQFLASLGYSPEDISAIVHGKRQLTPEELEKLKQWLDELEKTNPELAAKLRKLFGLLGGAGSEGGATGSIGGAGTTIGEITNIESSLGGQVIAAEAKLSNVNGLEGGSTSLARVAKSGIKKMASKISPYVGNNGEIDNKTNNNAALIAAGILGGGAAAGGGAVIGKKLSVIRFTPEDWDALGADYQSIIQRVMKRSGLTDEEIEIFKISKFQILASEINEHVKRIEKAYEVNPEVEEDLVNLYNFSMFDETHKVVKYLLFITMIIDGRNLIDQYNMYNIINQNFDDVDDADFIYSGITMDEYFYDMEEDKATPTLPKLEKLGEDKVPETAKDKEWLQGIGINE